jgi:hypothetical protein
MLHVECTRPLNLRFPIREQQLILHFEQLCDRCFPPTPAIVADIAAQLGGRASGYNWCV